MTDVKPNDFLTNLGDDLIAVDPNGNVLARAGDRASLEQAAPGATILTADDLKPQAEQPNQVEAIAQEDLPSQTDSPPAEKPAPPAEPEPEKAEEPKQEGKLAVDGSAFDHDGDGRVGGGRKRKPKAAD